MKLTFLGTGTSHGVPVLCCDCAVCKSSDPHDKRSRSSAYVQTDDGKYFLIDIGPDFRTQALRQDIRQIDAVLLTHAHADHIMGIDDLRAFSYHTHEGLNIYATAEHIDELRRRFGYVFADIPSTERTARPQLISNIIEYEKAFNIGNIEVVPLEFAGHPVPTTGYCFNKGRVVLIPDYKIIPPQTLACLQKIDVNVLIMPLTTIEPTLYHAGMKIDFDYIRQIRPKAVYFTHLGPDCDYDAVMRQCLPFMQPAYDGLTVKL